VALILCIFGNSLKKDSMKTGQIIRELRTKKGMTQEDLAAKTDITVRTIQRIESGEVDPRAFTLQSIANALEVDYQVLINSEDEITSERVKQNNRWLPLLHLSGLLLLILPPIFIWIWKRDEVEGMRKHAMDVINYQISMTLYLLPWVIFGAYPIVIVLGVYSQVMIIINTMKVANNQPYKYPLTIAFLKQQVLT
jgi:transcriptional regulator with XRE-family HTH domain